MKNKVYKLLLLLLILHSCGVSNKSVDSRHYRKSKKLATYSGMANEFQDGYLILKENNYFQFYQKFWLIVSIKQSDYVGRYYQSNDTLYLNWGNFDPKEIKYYMSSKCVIDSTTKSLWFLDEATDKRLWSLGAR